MQISVVHIQVFSAVGYFWGIYPNIGADQDFAVQQVGIWQRRQRPACRIRNQTLDGVT